MLFYPSSSFRGIPKKFPNKNLSGISNYKIVNILEYY